MRSYEFASGVAISAPDDVTIEEAGVSRGWLRQAPRGLPTGPIAIPTTSAEGDPMVGALLAQGFSLVQSFGMSSLPSGRQRGPRPPSRLVADLNENEDAVILLEQEGVYSWSYPKTQGPAPRNAVRSGPVKQRARRRVTFEISTESQLEDQSGRRRGPIADLVQGKVRVYVFRFVARVAVGTAIEFLERKKRTGLVRLDVDDPMKWSYLERLDEITLRADRPAHILLLIHGTFSSTLGSYGALGVSRWGREFLTAARTKYDAIIGYDHKTLSRDPLQNAQDLLGRLERTAAPSLEIDAVAFSRGGLVLRSLIEYLLPSANLHARVRRAVFVAATNGGTQLAERANWTRLIDLSTNLIAAGAKALSVFHPPAALAVAIIRESVESLGALVQGLSAEVLREEAVPGLAAMVPIGRFVTEINRTQPGQPGAAESLYYVISSDFDAHGILDPTGATGFSMQLVRWLADSTVDAAMREPNDLVVNTASTIAIDPGTGGFIKDHLHFPSNPHIYHTNYFTRDEVVRSMARWLGFEAGKRSGTRAPVPAGADDRLITVAADESFASVLDAIKGSSAAFVVAERVAPGGQRYRYAYRSAELTEIECPLDQAAKSLEEVVRTTPFAMHEGTSTPEASADVPSDLGMFGGAIGERVILLDGDAPCAVIDRGAPLASNAELAAKHASPRRTSEAEQELPSPRTLGGPRRRRAGAAGGARPGRPPTGTSAWSAPSPSAEEVTKATAPLAHKTVFVSADMPQSIPIDIAVPILVVVSHDEIVVTAGATRVVVEAKVTLDRTILVQVIAKRNLVVVGEDRAELEPTDPRSDLVFEVKGVAPGEGEVWILVRQGPVALITLKLLPQIVAGIIQPSAAHTRSAADAQSADAETATYPVLQIFEWRGAGEFKYHFVLQLAPGHYVSAYSDDIKCPPDKYVAQVYKEIEDRWLSTAGDYVAFEGELRMYGATLLDELVPPIVQATLWTVRDTLTAIQVVAEEPFIPWELIHLKPPRGVDGIPAPLSDEWHFLAQKGLVRWLHNRGRAPLQLVVRKGRSYYAVPKYSHPDYELPEAQEEIPFLEAIFGSKEVAPEVTAIQELLRGPGKVDHFHFSGHGGADAQNAADARLMLGGTIDNNQWIPRYLKSDLVAATSRLMGPGGEQPVIVLNACQTGRAGWRLTSIGGFAESFLRAGAGIFVGSLWSVGDVPARHFSHALYKALERGETLAQATVSGRDAARKEREATWLAYVVYGYPHAKVAIEKK